ncbi:hypothetical protein J6590_001724 [Homalodisca vitripennis]|nr:hypothetical protein J6590_001724 [Homalodisca vitripennis]
MIPMMRGFGDRVRPYELWNLFDDTYSSRNPVSKSGVQKQSNVSRKQTALKTIPNLDDQNQLQTALPVDVLKSCAQDRHASTTDVRWDRISTMKLLELPTTNLYASCH